MPRFVILGSCKHQPYAVLAMPCTFEEDMYNLEHEEAYKKAFQLFKPAIDRSNIIIVYNEFGVGEHTRRDLDYAIEQGKHIVYTHGEPEQ